MKIGLVGEAPLDTMSIKTILGKKDSNLEFVELLKNIITGSILENQTTKTKLRLECSIHRPDIVIFIRDLDGLLTKKYRKQRLLRQKYYREFKGCTHTKKTIYLLNIWEIETLILSDINCFNQYYKCNETFALDPMKIPEPKEFLYNLNKKYSESHNSKILEKSDFYTIYNNCLYFQRFINDFEKLL